MIPIDPDAYPAHRLSSAPRTPLKIENTLDMANVQRSNELYEDQGFPEQFVVRRAISPHLSQVRERGGLVLKS